MDRTRDLHNLNLLRLEKMCVLLGKCSSAFRHQSGTPRRRADQQSTLSTISKSPATGLAPMAAPSYSPSPRLVSIKIGTVGSQASAYDAFTGFSRGFLWPCNISIRGLGAGGGGGCQSSAFFFFNPPPFFLKELTVKNVFHPSGCS